MMALIGTRTGSRKAQSSGHNAPNATVAFNPTSLVNGYSGGFWRADKGVSTSGSAVTAWADQSTNGNNLVNVVGTPLWSSTKFNTSYPGVGFGSQAVGYGTGLSDALTTTGFEFDSADFSTMMLIIVSSDSTGENLASPVQVTGDTYFDPPCVTEGPNGSTNYNCFSGATLGNGGSNVSFSANTPVLLGCVCNGTVANAYLNGAVQGSAVSFTNTFGSATPANNYSQVGSAPGTSNVATFVMAAKLVTSRVLNSTDISNFVSWCNSTFGASL